MNPEEYRRMYDLEDRYWWFVGRRALALGLLAAFGNPSGEILDLGCGTGAVLTELAKAGHAIGLDMSPIALKLARERAPFDVVRADGTAIPFREASYDAILGLDVFEHIENDAAALAECARVLKPGGILVLSVPAFQSLWGPHDVALHHFRRYTRSSLRKVLVEAGFEPVKISYSVFLLFPVVMVVRFFEKRKKGPAKASLPKIRPWLNGFLVGLQALEAKLMLMASLPWGSSVVAVGRKPVARPQGE